MNRGALETRHAFTAEGLSQNDAAAAVECDSGNFSRILNGQRGPGRALAVRIASRFGVPVERWDEPASDAPPAIDEVLDDEQTEPVIELPPLTEVDPTKPLRANPDRKLRPLQLRLKRTTWRK